MFVVLLFALFINNCKAEYCPQTPCASNDTKCLEVLFNGVFYDIIRGIPALDIQSSEPLTLDAIGYSFSILDFNSYNNSISGLSDISISDVLISEDYGFLSFTIESPALTINSILDLKGYLFNLPVDQEGNATITFGQQSIIVYCALNVINGTDNKPYLQLGDFSLERTLESDFSIQYIVDEGDANAANLTKVNDAAAKDGMKLYYFAKNVVLYPIVRSLLQNFNKYLASVPKDNLIRCGAYPY